MDASNHRSFIAVAPQAFAAWESFAHLVREPFKYIEHRID